MEPWLEQRFLVTQQTEAQGSDRTDGSLAALRKFEIAPMELRTVVCEGGPSDGLEAIVFIHGHPGSSRDWKPLLAQVHD